MPKIGNINFENPLVLAPMAAVNCSAFRLICKEYGASLVSTQMFHCNLITELCKNEKERFEAMLGINKEERPLSIQIVGSDPQKIKESALILNNYADIIDFNLGCPEKVILANKAGAFFAKHPEQIPKVLKPIIENSKKPVTAKIRLGWDDKSITLFEQCKILQDLGVNAISIHARTAKQGYSGKANWDYIKQAKEKFNTPIIGNGDIFKPGTAKAMLDYSKSDFIMIGRGCLGNPLIFERTSYLLKTGINKPEPLKEEKKKAFLRFSELYKKNQEQFKISEFKNHAMWFTTGARNSKKIRDLITKTEDFDEIVQLVINSI